MGSRLQKMKQSNNLDTYLDKLVDGLIKYLDDDYLSVCEKTNEVFVEMFKAEGLASIDDSILSQ